LIEIHKRLQYFLFVGLALSISFNLANVTADGQEILTPQPTRPGDDSSQLGKAGIPGTGTGNISGTVIDPSGDVLQGAHVTLNGPSRSDTHTTVSGNDGQFSFSGLPPGVYKIAVTGSGMSTFT